MGAPRSVFDILDARRVKKAREIITDETHIFHTQVVNAVDSAIDLDPPEGWEPEDDAS